MTANNLHHVLFDTAFVAAVAVGLCIVVFGAWCAWLEEQSWPHRSPDSHIFGRMAFDVYRAFAFTGALTIVVSIVNFVVPAIIHEALPMSINWPLKGGAVFFLAVRLRWYLHERHTAETP